MYDALRPLDGVEWLKDGAQAPMMFAPDQMSIVEEMAILVRLAEVKGQIDRTSPTWTAVCSWAATGLLETFVRQESADDTKAAALRARARALRDLLALDDARKPVKFPDQSQRIP